MASEFLKSNYFNENLNRLKNSLLDKRNLLISSLNEELSGELSFHIPDGGIHIWCKLNEKVNEYYLLEEALRNGVAFVPGSLLGSQRGYIRLTFGRVESNLIKEGVHRLKKSFENL